MARTEAETGYFRSNNQSEKKPWVIVGALSSAVLAVGTLAACDSSGEVSPTLSPSPTPESTQPAVTSTPQETPIVFGEPFTNIPPVPPEFRDNPIEYWKLIRLEGNRVKLVANEFYEMDVIGLAGIPEATPGPGSTTVYVKARSVETAFGIKAQACEDILEAGGSEAAKIDVHFNVIVPNAGMDPFSEIGFTDQQKEEFLTPTTCGAVLAS